MKLRPLVTDEANSRFSQLCERAYKAHHSRTLHIEVPIEKVFIQSIQCLPFFNLHHVQNSPPLAPILG